MIFAVGELCRQGPRLQSLLADLLGPSTSEMAALFLHHVCSSC